MVRSCFKDHKTNKGISTTTWRTVTMSENTKKKTFSRILIRIWVGYTRRWGGKTQEYMISQATRVRRNSNHSEGENARTTKLWNKNKWRHCLGIGPKAKHQIKRSHSGEEHKNITLEKPLKVVKKVFLRLPDHSQDQLFNISQHIGESIA